MSSKASVAVEYRCHGGLRGNVKTTAVAENFGKSAVWGGEREHGEALGVVTGLPCGSYDAQAVLIG